MIQKGDMKKIMDFVAHRWKSESENPDSKLMSDLPSDFWMNSVGGKTANGGFWVTTLMYTENEADAAAFREVLLRWQSKGSSRDGSQSQAGAGGGGMGGGPAAADGRAGSMGPDLIQISKMRKAGGRNPGASASDNGSSSSSSSSSSDGGVSRA